jgi:probable HAF family extracellular repeat protein
MSRRVWVMVMCLGMCCAMSGSLGATAFRYQDLSLQGLPISGTGSNPASINAINDSAWIVGAYYDSTITAYQPFVWRPGLGRTTLQGATGHMSAYAYGLNNQGQIVGQAPYINLPGIDACYWSDPAAAPVALSTTWASLYTNCAYGINEAGQVAGEGEFGEPMDVPTHAARWPANHSTATDLGTLGGDNSSGKSINNAGWVVGAAQTGSDPSQTHACLWVPGQPAKDLVTLPPLGFFSSAKAVNNQGNVVGQADLTPGLGMGHAFFWDHQTDTWKDMCPADYESEPSGISDVNQVVGYVMSMTNPLQSPVFYWTPGGGKQDLNKMVVNLPVGVTLRQATAISRNGKVTGFDSQGHPYLLTPVTSLPAVYLLLLN